jgi:hypothetical protein
MNTKRYKTQKRDGHHLPAALAAVVLTLSAAFAADQCPGFFSEPVESDTADCSQQCTGNCLTYSYYPKKGECKPTASGPYGCRESSATGVKTPRTGKCTGISKDLGCGCDSTVGDPKDPIQVLIPYTTGNIYWCAG